MWPVTWLGTPPLPPPPRTGIWCPRHTCSRRRNALSPEVSLSRSHFCVWLPLCYSPNRPPAWLGLFPGAASWVKAGDANGRDSSMHASGRPPWGRRGRPMSPRHCPPRAHSVPAIPQPNTHQEAGRCPAQLLPDSPTPVLQAIPFLPLPDASPTAHPPDPQPRLVVVVGALASPPSFQVCPPPPPASPAPSPASHNLNFFRNGVGAGVRDSDKAESCWHRLVPRSHRTAVLRNR